MNDYTPDQQMRLWQRQLARCNEIGGLLFGDPPHDEDSEFARGLFDDITTEPQGYIGPLWTATFPEED